MRRYDVIFFDLDHTLIDTRRQYALGLAEALQKTYPEGFPTDYPNRFLKHHERLWHEYDARRLSMQELRRQRFLLAWRDYGVERSVADADAFYQTYSATLDTTLVAFPGVHEMLGALQPNYRLGVITNGAPDLQWRKLGITDLRQYFPEDSLIISEKIGKAKPDPSIFQFSCDALYVSPDDALMVGDNYDKDVLGARVFGMDALWLVPDEQMAEDARRLNVQDTVIEKPTDLLSAIHALERQR